MTHPRTPAPGQTFGIYAIDSLLGRGGMGTVYLATDERLGRRVALKVLAPELAGDDDFRARFLRESKLAASLDHPNVIPIYDAAEIDGVLYLAMRYVDGPSLHTLLRARGALTPEEAIRIAEQIGGALDAAHAAGLVHRDVKPANVLLAEPGSHAYLCDFGLAKQMSEAGATRTGVFLGTVDYCAPEQIEGRPVDGRADLYALGGVLFHCLTGRPPYSRDTEFAVLQAHLSDPPPAASSLRPELPRPVDAVLAKALAKDPGARHASASELVSDVRLAFEEPVEAATRAAPVEITVPRDEEPTRATPTAVIDAPRARSRRAWAAAAALAGVLIAAAVAAVALHGCGGGSTDEPAQRTFVDRVENVLEQSAAGRREIGEALTAGLRCSISPEEAARRIGSVADNRQSILEQLGGLPAPDAQAQRLVTLLQAAVQHSIEADRHYRDGFAALGSRRPCPIEKGPDFARAAASDARASAAKARFVAGFNALARRFGRETWRPSEI